jgi:hypothetical protein
MGGVVGTGSRMLRVLALVAAVVGSLAGAAADPRPAAADQAPFWESPVGLTPGHPDHRVRMLAEVVDVHVVEREDAVYAVVQATFDMMNEGPDIRMKVGFPNWTSGVVDAASDAEDDPEQRPFSPVTFTPAHLREFRVRTDDIEYEASEQEVAVGRYGGSRWLVWEMAYPRDTPVRVYVSYEQRLGELAEWSDPHVQPMYVLRTGALWHGTIGDATITMTAPSGGAFLGGPELFGRTNDAGETETIPRESEILGADAAVEHGGTRLVWQMRDFEPSRDVGTTYVVAGTWRALAEAEAAVAAASASASDYLRAAQATLPLIGRWGPHRVPRAIVERYPARARGCAWQAAALAPDDPAAWETVGDLERWFALPAQRHRGELACWPAAGAEAYQRAHALGSPTAATKLAELIQAHDNPPPWAAPVGEACPAVR